MKQENRDNTKKGGRGMLIVAPEPGRDQVVAAVTVAVNCILTPASGVRGGRAHDDDDHNGLFV